LRRWPSCASLTRQQGVFSHHLFDAEKQGSEIGGIFQMPADVVGTGGAKNTTHFQMTVDVPVHGSQRTFYRRNVDAAKITLPWAE
jgi:hypothetical protein